MPVELVVLRLVHVLGGIAWVGFGAFSFLFLTPALGAAGPAAGPVMAALQQRKLFTVLPLLALATMLSGLRLMMITSDGFSAAYFASRSGSTYTAGAVAAVVGFLIALLVSRPSMVRVGALLGARPTAAPDEQRRIDGEVALLRRRGGVSGQVATLLLLASAAAMAVARYL